MRPLVHCMVGWVCIFHNKKCKSTFIQLYSWNRAKLDDLWMITWRPPLLIPGVTTPPTSPPSSLPSTFPATSPSNAVIGRAMNRCRASTTRDEFGNELKISVTRSETGTWSSRRSGWTTAKIFDSCVVVHNSRVVYGIALREKKTETQRNPGLWWQHSTVVSMLSGLAALSLIPGISEKFSLEFFYVTGIYW